MNLRKLHQPKRKLQETGYFNMKHILPLNEWVQLNESYFNEDGSFSHLRDKGIQIIDKLVKDYGYSEKTAAAFAGNMFRESKFDPKAIGGSFKGLVQWGADRFNRLAALGISGNDRFTVDSQLKLLNYELTQTAEKGSLPAIEKAPTVEEAAYQVAAKYERCAESDRRHPNRIAGARELYDLYKALQLPEQLEFEAPVVSVDADGDVPPPE
jgi:hypothetical protein